jgi:NAD(P)H-nitrite reductase large subunit
MDDAKGDVKNDGSLIICRCEEISEAEIVGAVKGGCRSVGEVKRYCRAGMGLCQGRTCAPLVRDIIARETGLSREGIASDSVRFPVLPLSLSSFLDFHSDTEK